MFVELDLWNLANANLFQLFSDSKTVATVSLSPRTQLHHIAHTFLHFQSLASTI